MCQSELYSGSNSQVIRMGNNNKISAIGIDSKRGCEDNGHISQERQLSLTFSDLANILYPYCSIGLKPSEFVVRLIDKIMTGQPGRAHQDGTYQNPLRSKDDRTLLSYFNGERNIPRKEASIVLNKIDKYKFEMYLRQCSDDALKSLKSDLSKVATMKNTDDVVEVCTDQFESILKRLASSGKK